MAFKHKRLTTKAMEGASELRISKSGRAIVVVHKATQAEIDPKTKNVKGHIFAERHSYFPVNEGNLKRMKEWKPKGK